MADSKTAGKRELPYVMAINEAVHQIMEEMDNTFLAGEDVAGIGGVFGTYRGVLEKFGPDRAVDTPISEKGIIGLAVGAAATGLRPMVDIMFMDFLGVCMDEISNQMAKMRYMFGGTATLPVTVMTMGGAGLGMAGAVSGGGVVDSPHPTTTASMTIRATVFLDTNLFTGFLPQHKSCSVDRYPHSTCSVGSE